MGGAAIPVAKVVPQQATAPSQGPVSVAATPRAPHGQVRAQSPGQPTDAQPAHTSVFLHRAHAGKELARCTYMCNIIIDTCHIYIYNHQLWCYQHLRQEVY